MALCEKSVWKVVVGLVIAMFAVGLMISYVLFHERPSSSAENIPVNASLALMATTTIRVNNESFLTYKAITEEERARGLSGTEYLASSSAMLFVFTEDSIWGMWMKDMNYPLDMVWLDKEGTIVSIADHIATSTYAAGNVNQTKFFYSELPARYVVEFPDGTVQRTNIKLGQKITIE